MRVYCTSKNDWPGSSAGAQMVYLGVSIDEAEKAVGNFVKYHKEESDFPTNYPEIYSALPKAVEREIVSFYSADGWWYSIVEFELIEQKMHRIDIFMGRVICSCGYSKETTTGGRAARLGHIHAQNNKPSSLYDHRTGR